MFELGSKEILIIDLSSALVGMLLSSSKLLFLNKAHLNSGVRLLVELYCVIVIKHLAFFIIFAKFTFTFTSFLWTLLFSVPDVIEVSHLNKYIGGSMDLAKKRHGSVDLHTPIHPPLQSYGQWQDPITRSFHPSLWPSESMLFSICLFFDGGFRGCF